MNAAFLDAHERHWEDAELLKDAARLANADHLYGLAAECGLKELMICFGMIVNASGEPSKKDKRHVNEIWDRFETYRSGHSNGTGYTLPSTNPFTLWDVNQRYASREFFDQTIIQQHRQGALIVKGFITKARTEGLL